MRGRRGEDSPSEEVGFALGSEGQVGRKTGRNAVLPTRGRGIRTRSWRRACVPLGSWKGARTVGWGQLVEGIGGQAKHPRPHLSRGCMSRAGALLCVCRIVGLSVQVSALGSWDARGD